jgi:hypothetical protein
MSITVQVELTESVAAKARARGLLEPASVSRLIAREVDLDEPQLAYRAMVEKMRACPDDQPMSMDEIQAEVNAFRAERQSSESRR